MAKKHRLGLTGKLVLAIVAAGSIPIVVGVSVAYVEGKGELHEVIGSSFEALAQDSASKIDRECERAIARDRLVAARAAADWLTRRQLGPACVRLPADVEALAVRVSGRHSPPLRICRYKRCVSGMGSTPSSR